ncbi:zinc-binding dehydrogenase [Candidatus Woesearchaeota archaeon]|nr:zinc-binding dehydrogenase [Candidatus Woesearchaeota archaeon]
MKTRAAVLYEQHKPLVVEELETPALGQGQVLVKVLSSGICQTQLNEVKGVKGPDRFLPHLLGHEASGIVQEIGGGVTKVKPGDYVVLSWMKGSGLEVPSSQYSLGGKKVNAGAVTTFSTHSVVSENRITKIPEKVPADIAALLGCAVITGAGMVRNTLKAQPGSTLAVFGLGGVGLSAVLYAASVGCGKIIGIDIRKQKLSLAMKLGATHTIDGSEGNVLEKLRELTQGQGVDFAIESSGVRSVMELSFEAIRNGGTAVLAGNIRKGEKVGIDPYGLIFGKKLLGTHGGETHTDEDIPFYAGQYLAGKLRLDGLITHTYSLDNINDALAELESGNVGRAVIRLGEV